MNKEYPNLPDDVQVIHCTKDNPMPIEIADKVVELKQLWVHDDAEEEDPLDFDFSDYVTFKCPNCTYKFTLYLG